MSYRFTVFFYLIFISTAVMAGRTYPVSVLPDSTQANGDSRYIADVSSDGRYVAFASGASNLSATNSPYFDIFRKDMLTGDVILVSRTSGNPGTPANAASYWPAMSDDGNYIAYFSYATNLVPEGSSGTWQIYLYDVAAMTTTLVSKSLTGTGGNLQVESLAISGDGTTVAFSTLANDLVASDTNNTWDIFTWKAGVISRVSVSNGGGQSNGDSLMPTLSDDGRYVAFESTATNLVAGDTNGRSDIFVRDTVGGTTIRVSLKDDDSQAFLGDSTIAAISGDGSAVAFVSTADDLVAGDTNCKASVYLRNISAGTTIRIDGPSGIADGECREVALNSNATYLTFISDASNLVTGDTNGAVDVFRYAIGSGVIERVSLSDTDAQSNGRSYARGINSTGQYIAFMSFADNLVTGDTNGFGDLFLRDMSGTGTGSAGSGTVGTPATVTGGSTFRESVDTNDVEGNAESSGGAISDNGQYVAFASAATNLVAADSNGVQDIFLRDRTTGITVRISEGPLSVEANGPSVAPCMSADGSVIAFLSDATNLVGSDTNGVRDAFVSVSGTVTRVSVNSLGAEANGPVESIAISGDGRYIAFASLASNLDTDVSDSNGTWDIFLHDRVSNLTTRVSKSTTGTEANGACFNPALNSDGTVVAFDSHATNLDSVLADTNGRGDVFVHDTSGPTTTRISLSPGGSQPLAGWSFSPSVSGDGNLVAYTTLAWDLFPDDFNATYDIVLVNRSSSSVTRISKGPSESDGWSRAPRISSDGSVVLFESDADNLVSGDVNSAFDVYRYTVSGGTLELVSVDNNGNLLNERSFIQAVSGDGTLAVFQSYDNAVTVGDTNGVADVFVRAPDTIPLAPEIAVFGAGNEIASGDITPSVTDDTDFGLQSLSTPAAAHTFTITNTGTGDLTLTGTPTVAISGDLADFTITPVPALTVLSPAQSTTFGIQFLPTTIGLKTITVTIANDDSDESLYTFTVQGTGGEPEINVKQGVTDLPSGGTDDFGSAVLGGAPVVHTYTIENLGTYQLSLTGIPVISVSGVDASDFVVGGTPSTPVAVAGSTTFTITFTPGAPGARSATVSIANDDSDENPYTFTVQGTGIAPEINVKQGITDLLSGGTDDFGSVVLGDAPIVHTFTIENLGTSPLNLSNVPIVSVSGTDAADFVVGGTPTTPVAAGGSTSFTITFTPSAAATRTASVSIANDDSDENPYTFTVQGIGIAPNQPPVAVVTTPITARTYDVVTLDSSSSYDPDDASAVLTYSWAYMSGPVAAPGPALSPDAVSAIVTFTPSVAGTYVFEVSVSDGIDTATATVTVIVTSRAQLVTGSASLSTDAWTTVTLPYTYTSMVVAATPQYEHDGSIPPLSVRIKDVGTNTFSMKLFAAESYVQNVSSRTPTASAVEWTPAPWTTNNEVGPDQQTPDLTSIVQEIIDQPNWAMMNNMVIMIDGTGKRVADSFEGGFPPQLSIEYQVGATVSNLTVSVSRATDDVEERSSNGSVSRNSRDLELVDDSPARPDQIIGLMFRNINIPPGATILNASIQFRADERNSEATTLRIRGELDGYPANFGNGAAPLPIQNIPVHFVAAEQGVYSVALDGIQMEVNKATSSSLSGANVGWIPEISHTYSSSFTNPVVVGQIMTANNESFQEFWASSNVAGASPTAAATFVGRHLGESTIVPTQSEEIGYFIFEAGAYSVDGIELLTGLTPIAVEGANAPAYLEDVTPLSPVGAVLSSAGMNGADGGFPILPGSLAFGANSVGMAIEEDELNDADRFHVPEEVGYVAFNISAVASPIAVSATIAVTSPPAPAPNQGAAPPAYAVSPIDITLTGMNLDGSETWSIVAQPTHGTLAGVAPNLTYTPDNGFVGTDTFTFQIHLGGEVSNLGTITINIKPNVPLVLSGIILGRTDSWTLVDLPHSFTSAVVVCTPSYDPLKQAPVITRVRNVGSTSFEVRIFAVGGSTPALSVPVHYLVAEEGVYSKAVNGLTMEAVTFQHSGASATPRSYSNSYTNPVVIGQVMTDNDTAFQTFLAYGATPADGATATTLNVGRGFGESPNPNYGDETIGYIVMESGSGIVEGLQYETGVTSNSVTHNPYVQPISSFSAEVAVLAGSGTDSSDPYVAILNSDPMGSGSVTIRLDEDVLSDAERGHTEERVAFAAFDSSTSLKPFALDLSVNVDQDTPRTVALKATGMADGGSWVILTAPTHGTISGVVANPTYTPAPGYSGLDSFTYQVTNTAGSSNIATVNISVLPSTGSGNLAPVFESLWVGSDPDQSYNPVNLEAIAWDANDDAISIQWSTVSGPGVVTFQGSSQALTHNTEFLTSGAPGVAGTSTEATFDRPGIYVLKATVTDGQLTTESSVTLNVVALIDVDDDGPSSTGSSSGGGGCSLIMSGSGISMWLPMLLTVITVAYRRRRR